MKNCFTLLLGVFISSISYAQPDLPVLGQLSYSQNLNDIWGYEDASGTEYAIVGTVTGTSIVSLANPSSPVEVQFIPGNQSTWRDMKNWDNFVYVTTDVGQDGLLIIDMSGAPSSITHTWMTSYVDNGNTEILEKCHNIYLDENGYVYLAGCNTNNGGVIVFDVFSNPGVPQFVGKMNTDYAHDVYVRGDTLYSSDIYDGVFTVWDVSDKANPVELATQSTAFTFTHNAWISDNGKTVFTTDERNDAPVGAYDISDLNNIKELDQFRPVTAYSNSIPHNVHVKDDYLVISWYTDGMIIVDAKRPHNLIQVAQYDTWANTPGAVGFNGMWGAAPFLTSGKILGSDINSGLYVFQDTYQRGCYLEGVVTDAQTTAPIFDATIEISSTNYSDKSSVTGDYATGVATAGAYTVNYSKAGYIPETRTVNLSNGVLVIENVALTPAVPFSLSGNVVLEGTSTPIAGAEVLITNNDYTYTTTSNAAGQFLIPSFFGGDYSAYAGKWGYITSEQIIPIASSGLTLEIKEGIQDEFVLDLGWSSQVQGASSGDWERGEPIGTTNQGVVYNPGEDLQTDIGDQCYVTGNGGGNAGNDDIDGGRVVLTSPVMNLISMNEPTIEYHAWFANGGGQGTPNDSLTVFISNGINKVPIDVYTDNTNGWVPKTIKVEDFISVTNQIKISFEAVDVGAGHIAEAAVDLFKAYDGNPINTSVQNPEIESLLDWTASPNLFGSETTLNYRFSNSGITNLIVYDVHGSQVANHAIKNLSGTLNFGKNQAAGVYFAVIQRDGKQSQALKLVKIK